MRKIKFGALALLLCSTMLAACATNARDDGIKPDPHPNVSHLENALYATPENPVISPSRRYVLVIEPGFADSVYDNHFLVYTADDNALVYESDARYRTRDKLRFWWGEADSIWVYSGDTGTATWDRNDDAGTWVIREIGES